MSLSVATSLLLGILIAAPALGPASAESRAFRPPTVAGNPSTSGGAAKILAQSGPAARLATLNDSVNTWGAISVSSTSNVFIMAPEFLGGQSWDLGEGLYHSSPGVTNFSASSDSDFTTAASLLADGINEYIELGTQFPGGGGGGGIAALETYWLHRDPDLIGYEVAFILLAIRDLNIYAVNGGTQIFENYTWEIWGDRIFVTFYPPTDPNGTHLIDRRFTIVNVSLEQPGTAVLEWNGTNRTMVGNGTNWRANVTDLTNGVYAYRVWATNATGATFGSERRYLSVEKGIWSLSHISYGFLPAIAFDDTGYPHVCFYGGNTGPRTGLVYGRLNASGWTFESIEAGSGFTGESCSIALDHLGYPHISYIGGPDYSGRFFIKHAFLNASSWTLETVDSGQDSFTSIAMNPVNDQPMIAYYDVPGGGLKLASRTTGSWSVQVVDASFDGRTFSLAIDSTGNPSIAYENSNPYVLKYARWNAPNWSTSIIACCAYAPSLALDSNGLAHVAYLTGSGLSYASFSGSGWSNATVDVKRFSFVSLALDSGDLPHIAYGMPCCGNVRYAVENGTWNIQVVAHDFSASGLAMALRADGHAGILFSTILAAGDLVYATDQPDSLPPITTARFDGTLGTAGWYRSAVQATLVATDDLAVLNTTFRVDSGPWQTYSGPVTVMGDGNHTIEYFSTDYAENVEVTHASSFQIDSVPPHVEATATGTVGQPGWYRSPITITLTASDATSGVRLVTYRVDAGPIQNYAGPFEISSEGPHFVFYSAEDLAGNTASTQIFSPMIDSAAPTSSISVSGAQGLGGWLISTPYVSFSASDTLSGVASIDYRIDGGTWNTFTVPVRVADGSHTLEYRATDRAGNVEGSRTAAIDVDTAAPVLSLVAPVGPTTIPAITLSWTGADTTSGIARYEVRVDGGGYQDVGLATRANLTLSDGGHTIEVRAVDSAGNSGSQSTTVQVDTNVFSPGGPYRGVPLYLLIAGIAIACFTALWIRTRRRKGSASSVDQGHYGWILRMYGSLKVIPSTSRHRAEGVTVAAVGWAVSSIGDAESIGSRPSRQSRPRRPARR